MVKKAPSVNDWNGLYELRGDVERTLSRSCRDRSELDDVVQETLLRAACFRESLHDPERLKAWVMRIAWNVMRDHIRRQRRQRQVEVEEEFLEGLESPERSPSVALASLEILIGRRRFDEDDLSRLLTTQLDGLIGDERELYQAYYTEGLGCPQAARRLNVSPRTIKMRLFRLRRRLRRALKKEALLSLTPCYTQTEAVA